MSFTPTPQAFGQQPKKENRRLHARRRIDQLTYADFGPGNGGIVMNLGEGGLSFQGIGAVRKGQVIRLSFKLPGTGSQIEACGEVVWSNDSGKGGGLCFVDLSDEARQRIKEWLANDDSSSANFAEQVTPPVRARTLASSGRTPIPAPQAPTAKERPEDLPVSPQPQADELRQFFQPAQKERTSDIGAARTGRPSFILAEYPETQTQRSSSPKYLLFATGMLAGCVGVLAAIAGMRMLASTDHPTISESSQSPAARPSADEGRRNSPDDAAVLNDTRISSSNQSVDATEPQHEGMFNKIPPQEVAAIAPAPRRPELNVKPSQDFRSKRNLNDQRNLALLGPRMPAPRSTAEVREPSVADNATPTFITPEGPRPGTPSMPDLPKPPRPSAEKSDRSAGFMDAVLIQRNPPIYPASAMKKHIEGLVTISATIGTDGVPRGLRLVSGDPSLGQAAQEAISHWRYVPAVSGGVPVQSQVSITINFQPK
jgi:TonB family protein